MRGNRWKFYPGDVKSHSQEVFEEVLGHLLDLNADVVPTSNDDWGEYSIKADVLRRVARSVQARFLHELGLLSDGDVTRQE